MTDDERRLVAALNDALFIAGQALARSQASQDQSGTPPNGLPLAQAATRRAIDAHTTLGDLIGDIRVPSPE